MSYCKKKDDINSIFSPIEKGGYFEPKGIINRTNQLSNKYQWVSLGDKEQIGEYTRIGDSIFGGDITCNIKPLKKVDALTFQVCSKTEYARDKNHVYYPIQVLCIESLDCGGGCYLVKYILEDADPRTFQYLDKDYAKDKKTVFFRGKKIIGADPKTFTVIKGPTYFYFAKDNKNVFKHGSIFKNADVATFTYASCVVDNTYIIKDKNNTWEYNPPDSIRKLK